MELTIEQIEAEFKIATANAEADSYSVNNGYVYLVEFVGFYKIGHAKNVEERIRSFSNIVLPWDFNLVYKVPCIEPRSVEERLHMHFYDDRHRGEWFVLDKKQVALAMLLMLGYSQGSKGEPGYIQFRSFYTEWVKGIRPPYEDEYSEWAEETDPVKRQKNFTTLTARMEKNKAISAYVGV